MTRRIALVVLSGLLSLLQEARATTIITPEGITASAISGLIKKFIETHDGKHPESWNELEQLAGVDLDERMSLSLPTKRYALMNGSVRLPYPHEGRLLATTRRAIYDSMPGLGSWWTSGLRGPGRYVIYLRSNGEVGYGWMSEDIVKSAFELSGQLMPVPDSEPERIWVTQARRTIWISRGVYLAAALLLGWYVARKWRSRFE